MRKVLVLLGVVILAWLSISQAQAQISTECGNPETITEFNFDNGYTQYIDSHKLNSTLKLCLGQIQLEDGTTWEINDDLYASFPDEVGFYGFGTSSARCIRQDWNQDGNPPRFVSCTFFWEDVFKEARLYYLPLLNNCYPLPLPLGCTFPPVPSMEAHDPD